MRNQVIENYLSDPKAVDQLTKEAFQRSLKDIHAAHIFIAENADTTVTRKKLNEVIGHLQKGEDFLSVAQKFSDDPSAKENKGDLNFITVFTLPYEFETIVYTTPVGKYSKPYHSRAGYHIFKNIGERKAWGKIKIQHILLAFPPDIDQAGIKRISKLSDSLYNRIQAAMILENWRRHSAMTISVLMRAAMCRKYELGKYEPSFEKMIWSLPTNGAVSKPFITTYGYHIVKRVGVTPIVTNPADKTNLEDLKQKVMGDDRWKTARDFIYAAVKNKAGFTKLYNNDAVLWALSDSLLDYKPAGIGRSMNIQSSLFKIADTTFTVAEWIRYGQMNRYKADRSGVKSYPVLMDEFTKNTMYHITMITWKISMKSSVTR
ncbi:MAG: peptidylprolyl isomerase [Chitinophagaceae bacterium]